MQRHVKCVYLSALLFLLSLFILIPASRLQAATSGDNWSFSTSTGVLKVTGDDFAIGNTDLSGYRDDVKSIVISDSVTSLANSAFSGCTSVTSISLPSGITSVPGSCFYNCTALKKVTLASKTTYIGDFAFRGCSALKTVNIPDTVEYIGSNAFRDCSSLTGTFTIPEGITQIYMNTFNGCSGLTDISIPTSCTSISGSAFYGCSSLTSIEIPYNVVEISSEAFKGCSSLTSVTFYSGLERIRYHAFKDCTGLTEIILPETVLSVDCSFENCTNLTNIVVMNNNMVISGTTALGTSNVTVHGIAYSTAQSWASNVGVTFHTIDEGNITREATASSYGEKVFTCSDCGKTYTEELQPTALSTPTMKSAKNTGSSSTGIKVTWNAVSGATKYRLYRKTGDGAYKLIKTTSSKSYTDTNVKAGKTYSYVVEAYTKLQCTELSSSVSATYIKKPVISSVTNTSSGIKVKWKKVTGAAKYIIYRNGKQIATTTTATSYVDKTNKKNGTAYKYVVAACSDRSNSDLVKSSAKKTYYLLRQSITSATNKTSKQIKIAFSKNNKATGYEVQYSTSSKFTSSTTSKVTVKSYKTTTCKIKKLKKNKTYYIRVRSVKKVSGTSYYGAWSAKKKVKITK